MAGSSAPRIRAKPGRPNEGTETASQEKRSNEGKRRGPFDCRRAMHADRRDVRERKYKPPTAPGRFVFALSYIAAGRLRRPIERRPNFVIFVSFYVAGCCQAPSPACASS